MADNNTNNPNNTNGHLTAEDYGLTTPSAADTPVPAFGGSDGGNDYGISLPIAPEGGIPAYPGDSNNDYGISLPIAPEGGIPAYPGNTVCTPPVCTLPVFPSCPSCGISQNNAQVRFLNASSNTFPVNISIDNTNYATNSRFGTISNYGQISDGFHTVTVRRASGLRAVLLQQTFPFSAGQRYTMVLVDTAAGGLNMIQVPSTGCNNMNYNTGCYRVANMSYSGSSYDVMLYSHDAVFRNVGFQEVTAYKQAMTGSYQFYVTNANTFTVIRELPIIVIGTVTGGGFTNEPLVSYQVDIAPGMKYTSYLIGNNWSDTGFRVLTVED
ncbi:MAG: DUF4397 domain-containing protein [Hungatella sp.]|nr:DUF4397 domain-containing protein [Hungatella sp.]